MVSVYAKLLPDVPYIPLLYPNLGVQERESILFLQDAFSELKEPIVELTETPEEADYILLAHNYPSLKAHGSHVSDQEALARSLGKKLIIFWHGDSDKQVPYHDAVVFRTNQYRHFQKENEILMPAYAVDMLEGDLPIRQKSNGKPVIGFCGWAGYKNAKNHLGTLLKNSFIELRQFLGARHMGPRIKGITYRMKAISRLQESEAIETNCIIRTSYSGHRQTIKTDANTARQEYVQNMRDCDYALIIKGDGNYSYRFYEALSLGRIPVLLDTDCILPLEDEIPYDEFVVRVPYWDVFHIDHYVAEHFGQTSPQDFIAMQKKARDAYEQYLRPERFLHHAMHTLLPKHLSHS